MSSVSSPYARRFRVLASDPASGQEGLTYFNSTNNVLRVYTDGAWADAVPSDGGGGVANSAGEQAIPVTDGDGNLVASQIQDNGSEVIVDAATSFSVNIDGQTRIRATDGMTGLSTGSFATAEVVVEESSTTLGDAGGNGNSTKIAIDDNAQTIALTANNGVTVNGQAIGAGELLLASVPGVDFDSTTAQNLYTVPAGKSCIITKVVIRNPTDAMDGAGFGFGFDAGGSNWRSGLTDESFAGETNLFRVYLSPPIGENAAVIGAAGDVFKIKLAGAQGSPVTATIDVFGYTF
jgi:hypothetical protein